MLEHMKGAIFDLDGVIVDTAKYHFLAWQSLARRLGFEFTEQDNERLKGVSRVESLRILLEIGGIEVDQQQFDEMAESKNIEYVEYIKSLQPEEILPGAKAYLQQLKSKGIKIALGSASKNAKFILDKLDIVHLFDAIIDGTKVSKAKPDPEVFISASVALGLDPKDCVVFEDAEAGVQAGKAAGSKVVGIGSQHHLKEADFVVPGLYELVG